MLYLIVEDHDNLFVVAEIAHFTGIAILLYKLAQEETCSGASTSRRAAVMRSASIHSDQSLRRVRQDGRCGQEL